MKRIITERRDFKKLRQMMDFVTANTDRFAPKSPAAQRQSRCSRHGPPHRSGSCRASRVNLSTKPIK